MEKFKTIFKKIVNKETVLYVVFGVLTTLVNFVAFKLFTMAFDKLVSSQLGVHISNVLAWVLAVRKKICFCRKNSRLPLTNR